MTRPSALLPALAAFLLLIPVGCKHGARPAPDKPGVPVVPPEPPLPVDTLVGVIDRLGAGAQFVVIQLEAGQQVKDGEELVVRFAGVDVGQAKVSPERKGRFVTADVIGGTVEKGYEVIRRSAP